MTSSTIADVRAGIETKVIAAAAGSGLGAAFGTFLMWLLGVTVWHATSSAAGAKDAVAAVPEPVSVLLLAVLAVIGAAIAGYMAPHTPRATDTAAGSAVVTNLYDAVADRPFDAGSAETSNPSTTALPEPDGTVHVAADEPPTSAPAA